jgi:hypothetical protein
MFGTSYSRATDAAQNRKDANVYLSAFRSTRDAILRVHYRDLFRASLQLARALERGQ